MGTPLTFKVYRGDELLRTESFERDVIKIGKLASAHLRLEDEHVSRIHAVVEVAADGRMSVVDMGGPAGTLLNGRRVRRGAVRAGDELSIGGLRVVVEHGLPAARNVALPEQPPPEKDPPVKEPPVEDPRPEAGARARQPACAGEARRPGRLGGRRER